MKARKKDKKVKKGVLSSSPTVYDGRVRTELADWLAEKVNGEIMEGKLSGEGLRWQKDIATALDISDGTLSKWINGSERPINYDYYVALSERYGKSAEDLWKMGKKPSKKAQAKSPASVPPGKEKGAG